MHKPLATTPLPSTGRTSFPATGCGPPDQNRFNRPLLPLAAHGLKSRAGGRSVALPKLGVYPAVMARFLFATWEGGGHVQPMLLAARGLMSQGHEALAISDACNASDAAAHGVPFQSWRTAPSRDDRLPESDPLKDWLAKSPLEVIQGILSGVMCGPADRFAADTIAAIDAFAPDVVVVHELMFGAMAGAEARGAKLAVFTSNVWSLPTLDGPPPFGAGVGPAETDDMRAFYHRVQNATRCAYQEALPAYNAMRAALGLPPLADLFDQLHAAGRIFIATSRAFDFDQRLPEPYRYVGPYFEDPPWTEDWTSPWPADDRRPLVLVSFSTMYQGAGGCPGAHDRGARDAAGAGRGDAGPGAVAG